MTHFIHCKDFRQAAQVCEKFAKLYSDQKPKYTATAASVRVGEDVFIFNHLGKKSDRAIDVNTFCKKYFSFSPQKSQTP